MHIRARTGEAGQGDTAGEIDIDITRKGRCDTDAAAYGGDEL